MSDGDSSPGDGRVAVGRINQPWGTNGHVNVTPLTSNPDRLSSGATLYVAGELTRVLDCISPRGHPVMRFDGYESREAAQALRNQLIEIDAAMLPALPPDHYYVDELRGLAVVASDGTPVGELQDVLTTGANDVYVVSRAGQRDALIPAIAEVVLTVDLVERQMTIELVPGLLPD